MAMRTKVLTGHSQHGDGAIRALASDDNVVVDLFPAGARPTPTRWLIFFLGSSRTFKMTEKISTEKSTLELLGVRLANGQSIKLTATEFSEVLAFLFLLDANLRRCIAALVIENQSSEIVDEVRTQLQVLQHAAAGILRDSLRLTKEQGLTLVEASPSLGDLH